jgi:hypothetical protein
VYRTCGTVPPCGRQHSPFVYISFLMVLQPLWAQAAFQFPSLFKIGRIRGRVISSSQGLY